VWLFLIVSGSRFFAVMLVTALSSVFLSQYVASSVSFSASHLFLLIFSLNEIQTIIFVSVPVCILILLDNFKDVTAVRRGIVGISSLCWLVLQQKVSCVMCSCLSLNHAAEIKGQLKAVTCSVSKSSDLPEHQV